ncbi:phosphatase PAP2 family protein [Maricaulis sp. CAU 1757]
MRKPSPRSVAAVSLVGLVAVYIAVFQLAVVLPLDEAIIGGLARLDGAWLKPIFTAITMTGDFEVTMPIDVVIVGVLLIQRDWRSAISVTVLFLGAWGMVKLLKGLTLRDRPFVELYGGVENFSFPSGHATNTAVTIFVLIWLGLSVLRGQARKIYAGALIAWLGLMGLSRMYLQAHWPSDVLAGYLLAALLFAVVALFKGSLAPLKRPGYLGLIGAAWLLIAGWHVTTQFPETIEFYDPERSYEQVD